MSGLDKDILRKTCDYYTKKIKDFGRTSKGVDWNSKESQFLRFEQLSKLLSNVGQNEIVTLCDYGCGFGSYAGYLRDNNHIVDYTGMDVSQEMIKAAEVENKGLDKAVFICGSEIENKFDYIVASGIFNVKQEISDDDWKEYMIDILNKFNNHAEKGFSFNCLTKYSDKEYMKDYLYYSDPLFFFDYAKRHFSRNVALLHDYDLYEYTMIVRK